MTPTRTVLAVVLNWNRVDETLACLSSLSRSEWPALTTLVVDNASAEDPTTRVRERHGDVEIVCNPRNLGFAGGMNVGLAIAAERGADYALLLNNDISADPGMVAALVAAAESVPDPGIVCPLVLYRDSPETILSAGLNCDLRRGYQGPAIGMNERDQGQFSGVREVDAPSGVAMLVPLSAVRAAGPLDERLFLYGEDVEWSQRMRAAGLHVYVTGEARLWHGLSISSGGAYSPAAAYYQTRNSFLVCARHAPLRGPRNVVRSLDIAAANLVHCRRAARPLVNLRAVLAGCVDYVRGRFGAAPEWLTGREA